MAAPYNPPIKGQDFVLRISLSDMLVSGSFRANPTIAAGDFKVDKDGAGLINLATLPVVQPVGSVLVLITLSAAEMNADVVTIVGIDQTTTKEWADFVLSIPTVLPGELPTPLSTPHILMPDDAATITMGVPASVNGQSVLSDQYGYLCLNNTDYGGSLTILGYGTPDLFAADSQLLAFEWGSHAGLEYFQITAGGYGAKQRPTLWAQDWSFGTDTASHIVTYVDNAQDIGKATPTTDAGRPRNIFVGTGVSAAVSMGAGALASATTRLLLAAGGAAISSLRILAGTAPSTPTDGDMWFTGTSLQMRVGGVTKTITMT